MCLGVIPPPTQEESGRRNVHSVIKVTAKVFVGKKTKTKPEVGQWESISLRHPEKGQAAYKLSPWRLKAGMCAYQLLSSNTRHGRGGTSLALGCPGAAIVQTACAGRTTPRAEVATTV